MSVSDPIADMLTVIRNGCRAKLRKVEVPASKICLLYTSDAADE